MANDGLDSGGMLRIPSGIDSIPAQFDVTIPLVKMWQDGKGELRFEGVAASTSLDRQEERLTPEAIAKMEQYSGIDLLPSHGSGVLEELGVVEKCWLDNDQFRIAGSLDASNPEAVRLYEKLRAGKQYGLSVGGRVLSAHREFDPEAGKHVKYIDDVELDHVAVCRPSSAANPDTYLTVLAKAADAVLAEEPASDEQMMSSAVGTAPVGSSVPSEVEAEGNVIPAEDALFARLGKSIAEVCQKMWAFGASRAGMPGIPANDGSHVRDEGTEGMELVEKSDEEMSSEEAVGSGITGPASVRAVRPHALRQAPPLQDDGEGLERSAADDGAEEVFGADDAGWQDAMLGELHRQVESLSQAVDELKKDVEADEQAQQVVPGQPQAIPGQTRVTRDKQVTWKGVL